MEQKKRILIVDDEPDNLFFMKDRLEVEGYEVLQAADGEEALGVVQETIPDLILLDIMMPKRNGYQVCRELKNNGRLKVIPIIMLTAKAQESDLFWGKESGCDDYVTKPFDVNQVLEKVRQLLENGTARR